MEILITAALIAVAIFAGLAKVAQAMREPRPIDPSALVALEEKIAEATARADGLATLNLQLTQRAIEAREAFENMDGDRIRDEITSYLESDFDVTDHLDLYDIKEEISDEIKYDLRDEIKDDLREDIDDRIRENVADQLKEFVVTDELTAELEARPECAAKLKDALIVYAFDLVCDKNGNPLLSA